MGSCHSQKRYHSQKNHQSKYQTNVQQHYNTILSNLQRDKIRKQIELKHNYSVKQLSQFDGKNATNLYLPEEAQVLSKTQLENNNSLNEETENYQHQWYKLSSNIAFEANALFDKQKFSVTNKYIFPVVISVEAKDYLLDEYRVGIDLVCLIDTSASMKQENIEVVKNTLLNLLEILGEKDRLQLITFNDQTTKLTGLKIMTKQNKEYMKYIIESIQTKGGTNLYAALELAFSELKNRIAINIITSIFIFTDGQDNFVKTNYQRLFKSNKGDFYLHSFGLGVDHDVELLQNLAIIGKGKYHNTENLSTLEEQCISVVGNLVSIVGQDLEIKIKYRQNLYVNDLDIKTGNQELQKEQIYELNFPTLTAGQKKDFVFDLNVTGTFNQISGKIQKLITLFVTLNIRCPLTNVVVKKEAKLILKVGNYKRNYQQKILDQNIAAQYYKLKGYEVIQKAESECREGKFSHAKNILESLISDIRKDDALAAQSENVLNDIYCSLQIIDALIRKRDEFTSKCPDSTICDIRNMIKSMYPRKKKILVYSQPYHLNNTTSFLLTQVNNRKENQ